MTAVLLVTLVQNIGMALAVGSATYALIFYLRSGTAPFEVSERRFASTVTLLLHTGMALVILAELLLAGLYWSQGDGSIFFDQTFWFRWTVLGIILVNAALVSLIHLPRMIGPAISTGSWYMYLVATTLAALQPPYLLWIIFYVLFIGSFGLFLRVAEPSAISESRV
jgi:hypothetical protein